MQFNSLHFVAFFAIVFLLTALMRRKVLVRNSILLLASYYFYACWDWRFLSLILASTIIDYVCGRFLDVRRLPDGDQEHPKLNTRRRKLLLVLSLVTNLGLLGVFKYYGFFVDSAIELLNTFGFQANESTLQIVLPVGISFYTFQTLSYTIDVYRGRIPIETNLLNFALFVAFFPQLVAGPIERASHLVPQLSKPSEITRWHFHTGAYLVGWGLFKKVVLADNCALVANSVFDPFLDPENSKFLADGSGGGMSVYLGILAFAIQIYCDFSAYTDIARGSARMMGFDLMKNFNLPYFAVNPSDFWRRWHISLSTWLRDYLYIPLGGNHGTPRWTFMHGLLPIILVSWLAGWEWLFGASPDGGGSGVSATMVIGGVSSLVYVAYLVFCRGVYNNLMLTMLLGGLWHGARYTFVLWGLYHGFLLMAHRVVMATAAKIHVAAETRSSLRPLSNALAFLRRPSMQPIVHAAAIIFFFQFTLFGWLLFRAETLDQLTAMVLEMTSNLRTERGLLGENGVATVLACAGTLLVVQVLQARSDDHMVIFKWPAPIRGLVYGMFMVAYLLFGEFGDIEFIYFQF